MSKIGTIFSKSWFFLLILVILAIFVYNRVFAILITLTFIFGFIVSYIPSLSFRKRLIKLMNKYDKIEDFMVSRKISRSIPIVQNYMYKLSKRQRHKKWLIVYLDKRYIFYSKKAIQEFLKLYGYGYQEKKILECLKKNINLKTRAEIKAIKDTLTRSKRILEKEHPTLIENRNLNKSIQY